MNLFKQKDPDLLRLKIKYVGKNTYAAQEPQIVSLETRVGSFCSLGSNVTIGHGTHPMDCLSTSPYLYLDRLNYKLPQTPALNELSVVPPVFIGSDVWIGDGVFIKNGLTIGNGAVLGAHSVVTKDVPPYAVVGGVPARVLKYRFSPDIIARLEKVKWWELEDEVIQSLPYQNVEECLDILEKTRGLK